MGDVVPALTRKKWGWGRSILLGLRLLSILSVLAVIWGVGKQQFDRKFAVIRPIEYIGHSDQAAYATAGVSLAEGRGLTVPYISYYFIPYSPDITRREDHWPPFMGLSMAPCIWLLGKEAWVCKLPAIFFGSIGLPLATALLAYGLSRRGYVAIVAGLIMMTPPLIYGESEKTLSDVATAMLIAAFCGSVLVAQRRPWMHIVAGALIACAYFAKGSQIILLGLYPFMAVLCSGPQVLFRKSLWAGIFTALFFIAPYCYGNWKAYGSPIFSTQNYVSGFYNMYSWDESKAYYPYWGVNLPKTSDLWTKYGSSYWQRAASRRLTIATYTLSGGNSDPEVWSNLGKYGIWLRDLIATPPRGTVVPRPPTIAPRPAPSPSPNPPALAPPPPRTLSPTLAASDHFTWPTLGDVEPTSPETWHDPLFEIPSAAALLMIAILIAALPLTFGVEIGRFILWWRRRRKGIVNPVQKNTEPRPPWLIGPFIAVFLVLIVESGFIAYFWGFLPRFGFQFLPLILALGLTALSRFIEWPIQAIAWLLECATLLLLKTKIGKNIRQFFSAQNFVTNTSIGVILWGILVAVARVVLPKYATIPANGYVLLAVLIAVGLLMIRFSAHRRFHMVLTIAVALVFLSHHDEVFAYITQKTGTGQNTGESPTANSPVVPRMGKWFAANHPNAVIMCRNPWELLFYSGPNNKGIALPFTTVGGQASIDQIMAIANYYHVTHVFMDEARSQMEECIARYPAVFKRVAGAPGTVYEIDWTKIKVKTPEEACAEKNTPSRGLLDLLGG